MADAGNMAALEPLYRAALAERSYGSHAYYVLMQGVIHASMVASRAKIKGTIFHLFLPLNQLNPRVK